MRRSKFGVRTDRAGKVPESGVLRACLDFLAAERIWHRRWNTGAIKIGSRFFRFGQPGDGDILVIFEMYKAFNLGISPILWLECKSDSGKQTKDQAEFQREVEGRGQNYLLVRDVDTLRDWLKEHGV